MKFPDLWYHSQNQPISSFCIRIEFKTDLLEISDLTNFLNEPARSLIWSWILKNSRSTIFPSFYTYHGNRLSHKGPCRKSHTSDFAPEFNHLPDSVNEHNLKGVFEISDPTKILKKILHRSSRDLWPDQFFERTCEIIDLIMNSEKFQINDLSKLLYISWQSIIPQRPLSEFPYLRFRT